MKIDLKGILQGVTNSIFVKDVIEEMAQERLAVCRACPFNSEVARAEGKTIMRKDEHCLDCGCNLHLKSRAPSSECPQKKWLALATTEESRQIMELLEKNNTDES